MVGALAPSPNIFQNNLNSNNSLKQKIINSFIRANPNESQDEQTINSSDITVSRNHHTNGKTSIIVQANNQEQIQNLFENAKVLEIKHSSDLDVDTVVLETELQGKEYQVEIYGIQAEKNLKGKTLKSGELLGQMGDNPRSTSPNSKFMGIRVKDKSINRYIDPNILINRL